MTCTCIETVNELLKPRNTKLHEPMMIFNEDRQHHRLFVETAQIETGRGKPKAVSMFASFCPFCGVKYGEDAA